MLKKILKNVYWISELNASLKAWKVKHDYSRTVKYYARKKPGGTMESLLKQKFAFVSADLSRRPNIFYIGTDEYQDKGGILQALDKLGSLEVFTQPGGSYGQQSSAPAPEWPVLNAKRLLFIMGQLEERGWKPDILIAQTWAKYMDPSVFDALKKKYGTFIVNIGMDDRYQYWGERTGNKWGGTFSLIPHIDLSLTVAPECVDWYLKEGCPAEFFPEASDPEIYHPMPELPKIHEVGFVGGRYGIREKIVLALRKAGVKVSAHGAGWDSGRMSNEDVPRFFAQSKIVLGIGTVGHCSDFYGLKMRDFDGPMSGSMYLTHDNSDFYSLFEVGRELVTYRTIGECVSKVKYFLVNGPEREKIAAAGYARAVKDHSWEKRFSGLFEMLAEAQKGAR